ncbi:MAG: hypothetical protein LRY26_00455 [Bacilli bacterium]|nr:hypothetical protein [Bacilli bacterium]
MIKLYLHEYTVTPKDEDRKPITIRVEEGSMTFNDKVIEDKEILKLIDDLIFSNKEKLLRFKDVELQNAKGGRQLQLSVFASEILEEKVTLIGNSNNAEFNSFYSDFRDKLLEILK